jgi:hypothetical protein
VRFDDIMEALKQLDGEAARGSDTGQIIGRSRRVKDLFRPSRGGRSLFA